MITYWPSPAKLNIFLYITGQREDGYHMLQTLFQFLNYGDSITIETRLDGQLNLLTPIDGITYEENLIIRAARLLMKEAKKTHHLPSGSGADIRIKKRLPIGSGLGGGSSNAATVLVALNYLWKCGLTEDELANLGLMLGADVPIFIRGYTAFAEGIGEILLPVNLKEKWYLVIYPQINVQTSVIFKNLALRRNSSRRPIETLLKCKFKNVFEVIVREEFPEVDAAMSWLSKYTSFRLTGTGACIFSEFNTKSDADRVLKQAPKWLYGFVAQGVNISPLKQARFLKS